MAGDDILSGEGGDDILSGGAGNDTFNGGDGIDGVREAGDVNFILTGSQLTGLGDDTLSGIDWVILTGGLSDNRLDASGFTGIRTILEGGAGNDILLGGAAADWVRARGDVNFTLTDTQLTGLGIDTLVKMDNAELIGGTGNNQLDASGFTGSLVILEGQAGNDTLLGRTGGIDRIRAQGDVNFTLTDSQLTGLGTDDLVDIDQAILMGNSGDNFFDASPFTRGLVILSGGGGNDILLGGSAGDSLNGGQGDDTLVGGLGKDRLTGGLGADIFKYNSVAETGITNALRDVIKDFDVSQGDKIDLSGIDADTSIADDQAFTSLTDAGVFANPGELYFDQQAHIYMAIMTQTVRRTFPFS